MSSLNTIKRVKESARTKKIKGKLLVAYVWVDFMHPKYIRTKKAIHLWWIGIYFNCFFPYIFFASMCVVLCCVRMREFIGKNGCKHAHTHALHSQWMDRDREN